MTAQTDNTTKPIQETAKAPEYQSLQEWRQRALNQGIVPSKIDQYLLSLQEVPEAVKALIIAQRKEAIEGAEQKAQEIAGTGIQSGAAATIEKGDSGISGQVNVLDTKSQMAEIKREALAAQGGETQSVPEVQSSGEQKTEIQTGIQTQTAERKKLTTTQGTQSTDAGVTVRTSLGISGYAPSEQIAANSLEISQKGDVNDAKTWQAMLLQRFLELWGSFKGLFTSDSK